eukprot:4193663-Amphidinium_carterae.1
MKEQSKDQFALRYLELSATGLGDDGFLRLVPVMSSLDHLGVSGNGISSAGLEAVMNSTHMIQLKTLNLADNSIGEQGLHALTERFQEEHKRLVWNPKQLTSAIDTVILTGNPISQSLATSTEVFLKIHNPLLSVVWAHQALPPCKLHVAFNHLRSRICLCAVIGVPTVVVEHQFSLPRSQLRGSLSSLEPSLAPVNRTGASHIYGNLTCCVRRAQLHSN